MGARPVRSREHKLSFVHSMSPPEIVGTADSTVCTVHLNKAGKEAGGERGRWRGRGCGAEEESEVRGRGRAVLRHLPV